MVAIISGNGLGLFNASQNTLGGRGISGNSKFGQSNAQSYVNIATGNLIVQNMDQRVAANGQDILAVRTYNSQGQMSAGNQWDWDGERRAFLSSGVLNTANSQITVVESDGHQSIYKWISGTTYQSNEGSGAYDTINTSSNTWVWTDGQTQLKISYDSTQNGRLTSITGSDGTNVQYLYDANNGRLLKIKELNSFENELIYNYDNLGRLTSLDTRARGVTYKKIYYSYDELSRLSEVKIDLTPSDNILDNQSYSIKYTYDGTSSRIAKILETDGTEIAFTYEQVPNTTTYRVKTYQDYTGVITLTYDDINKRTSVTNGLNETWVYSYDTQQQLKSISNPKAELTTFNYDSNGNVLSVVDALNQTQSYNYDANGNKILEIDHLGNTITRTYNGKNQILTESSYSIAASKDANGQWILPSQSNAQTTKYIYDNLDHLTFIIGAEGGVQKFSYNYLHQIIKETAYGSNYVDSVFTDTALLNWSANQKTLKLTEYQYGYFGGVYKKIEYATVGQNGLGVVDNQTKITEFVDDQNGNILAEVVRRGDFNSFNTFQGNTIISSYAYDGLGRLILKTDANGSKSILYNGSATVVFQGNSSYSETYDKLGHLTSTTSSATGLASRQTQYVYDATGRLIMTQQPTGAQSFNFYDEVGRLVGVVDPTGAVTEYVYNKNGLQTSETRYATLLNTTTWYNSATNTVSPTRLTSIRPALNASKDRTISKTYDAANRLSTITDAAGNSTVYSYDTNDLLVKEVSSNRTTRYFYDNDGRQVAVLDAEGYLTEVVYNAASQKIQTKRYATKITDAVKLASGSLIDLRPLDTNSDLKTYYFYNARNQLVGSVDEQQFVTSYITDEVNNTQTTRRYSQAVTTSINNLTTWADVLNSLTNSSYQGVTKYYNNTQQLVKEQETNGETTTYAYDEAGRLIEQKQAQGSINERQTLTRYNGYGEVINVLSGEAAKQISVGMTATQIDAVFASFSSKIFYDVAGRKSQVMDAAGQLTTYYYDKGDRLTHIINADGGLVEQSYTVFGEIEKTIRYANKLAETQSDLQGMAVPQAYVNATGVGKNLKGGALNTTFTDLVNAIRNINKDQQDSLSYNKLGLLETKTNTSGNVVSYAYNAFGQLINQTNQVTISGVLRSIKTVLDYNKRGELSSQTLDQLGFNITTRKTYDAFGRVVQETDARGIVTSFDYSQDSGRKIIISAPNNNQKTSVYDAWNRVVSVNDNGRITSYAYDDTARTLIVTSAEGVKLTTSYNEFGETITVADASGIKTTYGYNADGQKITETDALGNITRFNYANKTDSNTGEKFGLLKETISATGITTKYFYDAANRIVKQQVQLSANKVIETRYTFDGQGRQLSVTEGYGSAEAATKNYSYDKNGRLESVIQDPSNLKLMTSYQYDELGQQVKVLQGTVDNPQLHSTVYNYDAVGRRTSEIQDPNGLNIKTEYFYDANGNLSRKKEPLGNNVWYIYDAANKLSYTINSIGVLSRNIYNSVGQLTATYEVDGSLNAYLFNDKNVVSEADIQALNPSYVGARVTRSVYNQDGQIRYVVDALGYVTENTYNNLGQLTATIRYLNSVALTGDQLSTTDVSNALTAQTSAPAKSYLFYDQLGRLAHEIDALGYITSYWYNALGQVIQQAKANQAVQNGPLQFNPVSTTTAQLDYYYKASRESGLRPAGKQTNIFYDGIGRKKVELDASGIGTLGVATFYNYNTLGQVTGKIVTGVTGTYLLDLLRTTDANSAYNSPRPEASTENLEQGLAKFSSPNIQKTYYYYDSVGRIAHSVDALGYITSYWYDDRGLVIKQAQANDPINKSPAAFNPESVSTAALDAYYKAANLPAGRQTQAIYDEAGRKRVEIDANSIVTLYNYNALGQVVAKIETGKTDLVLLDLLRSKDAAGNYTSARPEATLSNFTAASNLVASNELRKSYFYYNILGQQTRSINAEGYVIDFNYNSFGQISRTIRYFNKATSTGNGTFTPPVMNDLLDQIEYNYYDLKGNLTYQLDALRYITVYKYDAFNNLVSTSRLNTALSAPVLLTYIQNHVNNSAITRNTTNYSYDLLNRRVQETDAEGKSITTEYDGFGNASIITDKLGNKSYFYYDNLNRNIMTVDVAGYVTQMSYNAFGQLSSTTRYSNPVDQTPTASGIALRSDANKDQVTYYAYDLKGNLTNQINPENYLTRFEYNAFGQITKTIKFSNKITQGISNTNMPNYGVSSNSDQITYNYYDLNGNLTYQLDAARYLTVNQYDAFNNIISTVRSRDPISVAVTTFTQIQNEANLTANTATKVSYEYDKLNRKYKETDAELKSVTTQYDAFGNAIIVTDKLGNKGYFGYDQLNRNRTKIDPEGYLTIYDYNAMGSQIFERKYLNKISGLNYIEAANGQINAVQFVATNQTPPSNLPYLTNYNVYSEINYQYDALNRKIRVSDAVGNYEQYTYTAGNLNPTTYRNKLGGVYSYVYDKLGRLTQETLPELSAGQVVINTHDYDAFGNRIKFTEAKGLAEQRVSSYEYDKLNRIISKTGEAVDITLFKVSNSAQPDIKNKISVLAQVAKESYQYDAFGNQILKIDANGAKTFSYYDNNSRKIAEINAEGLLTQWSYDAAGQITRLAAYQTPVSLPAQAGGNLPAVPTGNVRISQYAYDKVGRQTLVVTPDIYSYEYDINGVGGLAKKTAVENKYYDANGNLIRVVDAKGNSSYFYYDKLGRKVLTVDNAGYVTKWSYDYDATNNLNTQTETKFAKALTRAILVEDSLSTVSGLIIADSVNDRTSISTFDKAGRVIKTELLNVQYFNGSSNQVASSITTFTYNGLDKVLTKTDSTGTIKTDYDKLGRETVRTFGEYVDSNGASVKQRISSAYNGLGALSSTAILGTNDTATTDDRITQYSYDKLGRVIAETDVNLNHVVNYGYDLVGNRTWVSTDRKTSDSSITKTDETLMAYNSLGQEISRRVTEGTRSTGQSVSAATWKVLEERETRYNLFGEITGKRLVQWDSSTKATDSWQESTEYNNQGKVWKSNANNGVTRYYLYDLNGNATLQLDTTGSNSIVAQTPDQLSSLSGVTYTETVYDQRNQVKEVRQPKFNQQTLDTSLNLFSQNVSRSTEKSTVTLTDSSNKLSFNSTTQKLSLQANTQANRVVIKYWPQGTTATADNTYTVDMQATATTGQFILDVTALRANSNYSYSYSSSNSLGQVLDTGAGNFNRAVNMVDAFSGGSVSATPSNVVKSVAATLSNVAVDYTSGYKLSVALNGTNQRTIYQQKYYLVYPVVMVSADYYDSSIIENIDITLPTNIKSFGDGNFEVELSIDGQIYTRTVSNSTNSINIILDKNIDKSLNGKAYTIKVYKRTVINSIEFLVNTTNIVPEKTYGNMRVPNGHSALSSTTTNLGSTSIISQINLNDYNQLMISSVPLGTKRVDVRYKLQGLSQWSTLTDSAPAYSGATDWYKVALNSLEPNRSYDYQYITYDASGNILGGGKGVLTSTPNSPVFTQQALTDADYNLYSSNNLNVNTKQDTTKSIYFNNSFIISSSLISTTLPPNTSMGMRFNINNDELRKAGVNEFMLSFTLIDNDYFRGIYKYYEQKFSISAASTSTVDVYLPLDFKLYVSAAATWTKNWLSTNLSAIYNNKNTTIGSTSIEFEYYSGDLNSTPSYYRFLRNYVGSISVTKKISITLSNQVPSATEATLYYRELGSKTAYSSVSGSKYINNVGSSADFDFSTFLFLDPIKKYEIKFIVKDGQRVTDSQFYIKDGQKVINSQQGVLFFDSNNKINISISPVNFGGDGTILFSGNQVVFIDQFRQLIGTEQNASKKIKIRPVGGSSWVNYNLDTMADWWSWEYSNNSRVGDYEFKLESYSTASSLPVASIIGKLRFGAEPAVLNYIPSSFYQNQITFAAQPAGSSKITVKYGTSPTLLDKTAQLSIGADGKAILDATSIAETNLFGATTVYYSYETSDANGTITNRAKGSMNVGLGAGVGQQVNLLNDSWLDFQPAQSNGVSMEVYYRKRPVDANGNFVSDLVSTDLNNPAAWGNTNSFQKATIAPQNGVYRWNINSLVPSTGFENYEYFYQLYDQNGKVIAMVPGKLTVDNKGNGSTQQSKWVINNATSRDNQIIRTQNYNAFGEIISETDGNGNTTSLSYNTLGKLLSKVLPKVDVRLGNGSLQQNTPTLEYAYDLAGRLLQSKDANGNINKLNYVNGHNLESGDWLVANELHADAGQVNNAYDVFGNLKSRTDELGFKTNYDYDINGNLIKTTRAARTAGSVGAQQITTANVQTALVDQFEYDQLGNRIRYTNALGFASTTDYDALARVVKSQTAEGAINRIDYVYDANIANINGSKGGLRKTETDALGKTIVDAMDYYGRVISHTDKGGHVALYNYNAAGWLMNQTNSQGQNIDYSYYSNGYMKEIRDNSLNVLTSYRYDNNGNKIEERYQELNAKAGEPRIFQNAAITYDALNRKMSVQDQSFNISYEYDANGNIIHMLANYRDAVNAAPKTQNFWYRYDSMNRFTVSMGVLNTSTQQVERGDTGIAISYNALGQRLSADYGKNALNSTKAHKERYTYTSDGYLESVKNADYAADGSLGVEYNLSVRYNDALGRVVKYEENNLNSNTVYQTTTTQYNKDNQVQSQTRAGGTGAGTTVFTYLADKVTLDKTVMTPTSGSVQTTQYGYEWWDSAKQKTISTTVNNLTGITTMSYDMNGHLSGFVDAQNPQNKRSANYVNNSQGMVLQRNELINGSINRYRNFYYVNGQRVGDLSNDGPSREDYVQSIQSSRETPVQAKDFKPISSADFDQNFEPINAQYPSSAATTYVANNGDTLQSIALSVWGDASMWYLLADANGLSVSDKLTAGQVLTVPNKVTNIHNSNETYRVYNAGEAIGNTQPTLPDPPPPPKPKKKCGGVAMIIMIVVAVVATVLTAGAAALAFSGIAASSMGAMGIASVGMTALAGGGAIAGGLTIGLGAAVGGAMIGAAVGSAVSQLAGKAMGVVDHFSWKQVGISALTAGLTAGVGGALGGTTGLMGSQTVNASGAVVAKTAIPLALSSAIRAGVGYGASYISNRIAGNNPTFSWSSVAANSFSAAVGSQISLGNDYVNNLISDNLGAFMEDKWFGGARPDYVNVSLSAIANAAGQQISNYASNQIAAYQNQKAKGLSTENKIALQHLNALRDTGGINEDLANNLAQRLAQNDRVFNIEMVNGLADGSGQAVRGRYYDNTVSLNSALDGAGVYAALSEELAKGVMDQVGLNVPNFDFDAFMAKSSVSDTIANLAANNQQDFAFAVRINGEERSFNTSTAALMNTADQVFSPQRMIANINDAAGSYQSYWGNKIGNMGDWLNKHIPESNAQGAGFVVGVLEYGVDVAKDVLTLAVTAHLAADHLVYSSLADNLPKGTARNLALKVAEKTQPAYDAMLKAYTQAKSMVEQKGVASVLKDALVDGVKGPFVDAQKAYEKASSNKDGLASDYFDYGRALGKFSINLALTVVGGRAILKQGSALVRSAPAFAAQMAKLSKTGTASFSNILGNLRNTASQFSERLFKSKPVGADSADSILRNVQNLTERGTLVNLRPKDIAISQRPIRTLVQDVSGRYWLQSSGGNRITPSGSYDFVTMPDGSIRVARPNTNPDFSTHLGLSGGGEVNYAGSIRFGNNMGKNRGTITNWTNNSGHYQPPAVLHGNAGLPDYLFRALGR